MWRPHGKARVNPSNPEAFAVCDRCSQLYNHVDLQWQYAYRGNALQNTWLLVCDRCYDIPAEFTRPIILGPDPLPIMNPRPEPYASDFAATNPNVTPGQLVDTPDD